MDNGLKRKILVVDDELGPREALKMILGGDYTVSVATGGIEARNYFSNEEYDLMIMDIKMPDINGIDLLTEVKTSTPETEVIMITAYASVDTATDALRMGALDYIIKPFDTSSVLEAVQKGLSRRDDSLSVKTRIQELQIANKLLEEKVDDAYENIQSHFHETVDSLVEAVDAKDSYTKGHLERMSSFALLLGKELNLSQEELDLIQHASVLHDIGKIGVPEAILLKKDTLSREEFEIIKKHPVIGARIISPVKSFKEVVPLVLYHHEKFDGTGYPDGLKGNRIPLGARIIGIADAIDAMLTERPYAGAKNVDEVQSELKELAGIQFDPKLVNIILSLDLLSLYAVR